MIEQYLLASPIVLLISVLLQCYLFKRRKTSQGAINILGVTVGISLVGCIITVVLLIIFMMGGRI